MLKLFILVCALSLSTSSWSAPNTRSIPTTRSIKVATDVEVPVSVHGPQRQKLVLWLPSEHGVVSAEQRIAQGLVKHGYEVWVADLFAARFLPIGPSSLQEIPTEDVAQLIRAASKNHRKVILVSSGQGAARALEGAHAYQQAKHAKPLAGAVLLFPNLFAGTAEAGVDPQYLPVARQTRMPIAILQGNLSPWYWQLDDLKGNLSGGGSSVQISVMTGLRDRFYFREDATPPERSAGQQLPETIHAQIQALPTCLNAKR